MYKLSKHNIRLLRAYDMGYRVSPEGEIINRKGDILKGSVQNGYARMSIRIDKISNPVFVHRLQAYLKFGNEIFKESIEVRHLNGNSLDNSFKNIAIGTHSDNMQDIPKEKRMLKSSLANLKHDHKDIICDRNNGMKYSEIMLKYGISSKGTVSYIINKSFIGNLS